MLYDIVVVGAGIVGLATARALVRQYPVLRLAVLDKEAGVAQHQTGRNSGVIHSGLYYKPGSLKARFCVAGAAAMMRYCEEHDVPFKRCGKVVVAVEQAEVPRLEELLARGLANGVPDLALIDSARLREIEPHAAGLKALHSPGTAIVDYRRVADSFAAEVRTGGGLVRTGFEVTRIEKRGGIIRLISPNDAVESRFVVVCGGVYADRLAALVDGPRQPAIIPFRGDYFVLNATQRHLINALIYPVPDPNFPFLGVHSTLKMDGSMWLGPNAVLAFGREGYGRFSVNWADLTEVLQHRGFRRLAMRYWRTGLSEMIRDVSKRLFVEAARRYVPALEASGVEPGPAGIRAQALGDDGALVDDFVIHQSGPIIHVRNAPSPAATASLPIGEYLAAEATRAFGLAG
jgi:L-2-hydroxyglutarate oxidase